ncbi:unnamed protein product, partial [Dibothriocephalus latus]
MNGSRGVGRSERRRERGGLGHEDDPIDSRAMRFRPKQGSELRETGIERMPEVDRV